MGEWGYIENKKLYVHTLRHSDAVLSTAIHDFQGISILEAAAVGCIPIVPDRLAYRELFTNEVLYSSHFDIHKANTFDVQEIEQEATALASKIQLLATITTSENKKIKDNSKQHIQYLSWRNMKEKYTALFEGLSFKHARIKFNLQER